MPISRHVTSNLLSGALLTLAALSAQAETAPLWELGPGLSVLRMPDYRGARTDSTYLLPFPYLVYRGKQFRVDQRKGVRSLLWRSDYAVLDISVNGSMPVNSDHTPRRQGMPNLDPAIEIGPSLEIPLSYDAATQTHWEFNLPLRAMFSTDFRSITQHGWIINPRLEYLHIFTDGAGMWRVNLAGGPLFATPGYHGYYYDVRVADTTPDRPTYKARGGYSGTRLYASLSKYMDHQYRAGGFISADLLANADFLDSPLVERRTAFYGGVFVSWILMSSRQPASEILE